MTATFTRICRTAFSTKRPPVISGGKAGVPTANLTGVYCTAPIQLGSSELQTALNIETLYQLYEVHTAQTDIKTGDLLVIASVDYPVVLVEPRTFGSETRTRVVYKKLVR
jgi:hypothetical protein